MLLSSMEQVLPTQKCFLNRLEYIACSITKCILRTEDGRVFHHVIPSLTFRCSDLVALRVAYLASLSHNLILHQKLITKRDVYYMCRALFPNPESVDRALMHLASISNAHRNELHIIAAPKGLVAGNVSYCDGAGNLIDVSMFGNEGCLIPARPERMLNIIMDAKAILV